MLEPLAVLVLNLKGNKSITIGLNLVCALCPSLLTLFFFKTDLFERLETFKLILTCSSIGFPILLLSYYICIGVGDYMKKMILNFLRYSFFDRKEIEHEHFGGLKGEEMFKTWYMCGILSSVSWILVGILIIVISIFIKFNSVYTYCYIILLSYVTLLIIISNLTKNLFMILADHFRDKLVKRKSIKKIN